MDLEWNFQYVDWLKPVNLENKALIIEFWGSWCSICEYTLNPMNLLHEKMKGKPVEVIGISHDYEDVLKKFLENHDIKYTLGLTEREDFDKQFEMGMPFIYVLDKNRKVHWSGFAIDFLRNNLTFAEVEIQKVLDHQSNAV